MKIGKPIFLVLTNNHHSMASLINYKTPFRLMFKRYPFLIDLKISFYEHMFPVDRDKLKFGLRSFSHIPLKDKNGNQIFFHTSEKSLIGVINTQEFENYKDIKR